MTEHHGNNLKEMVKEGLTSVSKLSEGLDVNRSNIYYLYGLAHFNSELIKKLKQLGIDVETKSKQTSSIKEVYELQREIILLQRELSQAKEEIITLQRQLFIKPKKELSHLSSKKN